VLGKRGCSRNIKQVMEKRSNQVSEKKRKEKILKENG